MLLMAVLAFADIIWTSFFYDISSFTLTGLSVINLNTSSGNTARWTGHILAYNPHSKIGIEYGRIGAWISTGDSKLASGQIAPFNQGPKGETRLSFTLPYTRQAPVLGLGPVLVDLRLTARYRFQGVLISWVNYGMERHISCENIELVVVASGHGSGTTDSGRIWRLLPTLWSYKEANQQSPPSIQCSIQSHWIPPPIPCFKLNTNVAMVKSSGIRVSAVVRDYQGWFVAMGTNFYPGIFDATLGEAYATRFGLDLVRDAAESYHPRDG
ncbi:hypothetical protein Tsubulata_035651 [Turnera subulata]|uniref:Late embryogenesis abundant protein LEA-2 subgroup domain-containing protein n=1 Tax=Turnera subulata TaxID=218843 RepID=A0A9Q0FDK0_9ROSI|nr:hypothetical protein Tsubulata_035651 [Turnera subulata]